ncbi:outer membrane beta-barrel protein [Azospirillum sp. sgz301742]
MSNVQDAPGTSTVVITNRLGAALGAVLQVLSVGAGMYFVAEAAAPHDALAQTASPRPVPRTGAKITTETTTPGAAAPEQTDDSTRVHDSYQPKGIELGEFLLLPKIDVDEMYNTNFYATENDKKSEFITAIRPELKLRSRFREHALNVVVQAEQYLHRKYTHDNRLDLQAEADGRYDFSTETQANGYVRLFSQHEDRGSPDDTRGLEPAQTRGAINRFGVKHQFGRFTVGGDVGLNRRVFNSVETSAGTTISNQDRDRWESEARVRGGYEFIPGYAAITEASINSRRYDDRFDRRGFERSSHGYRIETGVGVDVSQLIRGDFLVGYLQQDYRDPRLSDPQGLSFRATFNWTPSTLTVVVPSLERTVNETTTTGASAMVRNGFSLLVRHELERNIVLTGYAGVFYDQYSGLEQSSWTYEGRARATYAFTPELYVASELAYRQKDSQIVGQSFDQAVIMLRLGLQM